MKLIKLFLIGLVIVQVFSSRSKVNNCRGVKMRQCKENCNGFENIASCDLVNNQLVCNCKEKAN